ncbi:MAG: SH3 domain-containing protein [Synechococcales bacterium]|nr:SH3 domain-containing protein [Synechococcales bacterium]
MTSLVCLAASLGVAKIALAESASLSSLKSGTYFAQGTMYARSYRVVARSGNRLCIKIASGPPNPYEGSQSITISTIGQRQGQTVVTATQEPLMVQGPEQFFIGNRAAGEWQLAKNFSGNLSAGLQDCLAASGNYAKRLQGPFVTGMISPNAPGQLTAKEVKARINVRQEPGETAKILHYGLAGDRVKLLYSRYDQAGRIWYQVKFDTSGAEGWVRSDFVRRMKTP